MYYSVQLWMQMIEELAGNYWGTGVSEQCTPAASNMRMFSETRKVELGQLVSALRWLRVDNTQARGCVSTKANQKWCIWFKRSKHTDCYQEARQSLKRCRLKHYQEGICADEAPELICLRQVSLVAFGQGPFGLFIHADVGIWLRLAYRLLCSSLGHGQGNMPWRTQRVACSKLLPCNVGYRR